MGDHARLAGAGAGEHEQGAAGVHDGLPLGLVQALEKPGLGGSGGHHRFTIDPAATTTSGRSKAYKTVGFEPVGIMRQYERGPDGSWHDGLLMDLVVERPVTPALPRCSILEEVATTAAQDRLLEA